MKTRMLSILLSVVIGVAVTALLTVAASVCYDLGAAVATRILAWPNALLQGFVPSLNIGTAEKPLYEGTPLNILAHFASFPLSVVVYSVVAYMFILSKRWPMYGGTDRAAAKEGGDMTPNQGFNRTAKRQRRLVPSALRWTG